jgi:hypothetical protein
MTYIDPAAAERFRLRAKKTFGQANFAYLHSLRLLFSRLQGMRVAQDNIVLFGINDAEATQVVRGFNPATKLRVLETVADINLLKDGSCPVIVVNLIFSVDDIDDIFSHLKSKLAPEGVLLFALLGTMTFEQLKQAIGPTHPYRVASFYDMHDLGDAMLRLGYASPIMEGQPLVVRYQHLDKLFNDLRLSGCSNALSERPKHLTGRQWWQQMVSRYPENQDGKYHLTLDYTVGHAWQSANSDKSEQGVINEVTVPVDQLKR